MQKKIHDIQLILINEFLSIAHDTSPFFILLLTTISGISYNNFVSGQKKTTHSE
jgi:hypothetical protein